MVPLPGQIDYNFSGRSPSQAQTAQTCLELPGSPKVNHLPLFGYGNGKFSQTTFTLCCAGKNLHAGPALDVSLHRHFFWINDTHPRMIMHPYRADLEGKDVTDTEDPAGKKLFQAFLQTVKASGGGYVDYHWQWQTLPGYSRRSPMSRNIGHGTG
jgi:hypothetical protein